MASRRVRDHKAAHASSCLSSGLKTLRLFKRGVAAFASDPEANNDGAPAD